MTSSVLPWAHLVFWVVVTATDVHPRYARVDGSIETVWQRPLGDPKGIFFFAHGCNHQGTDFFSDVGPDGWIFEACASSNSGQCLGLPEEVRLRQAVRARGYVAMAVSGGSGRRSCWDMRKDPIRVARAIRHVQAEEGLPEDVPVLAIGASSGGAFMGTLAAPLESGGLPRLKCIVPQISALAGGRNRGVPTLFVHMPRDEMRDMYVKADMLDLAAEDVRTAEIRVQPIPVTALLLERCLSADVATVVLESLRHGGHLDREGYQKYNSRARTWVSAVSRALPPSVNDTLKLDESCLAELMNVAWAEHEITSQYADQMIDFCEGRDVATKKSHNTDDL